MASFTDTASPGSVLPRITSPEAPAASSRRSAASRRERKSPPPLFPSPLRSLPPKNHFDSEKKPSPAAPGADAVIAAVAYSVDDDGGAEGGDAAAVAASYAIAADDFFNDLRGGSRRGRGRAENHDDVGCLARRLRGAGARRGDDENRFLGRLGRRGRRLLRTVGVAVRRGSPPAAPSPRRWRRPRRDAGGRRVAHRACFRECDEQRVGAHAPPGLGGEGERAACFASATFLESDSSESAHVPPAATAARARESPAPASAAHQVRVGRARVALGGVGGLGMTRRGIGALRSRDLLRKHFSRAKR